MSGDQGQPTVGKAAISAFMGGASIKDTMKAAKDAEDGVTPASLPDNPAASPAAEPPAEPPEHGELKELEHHIKVAEAESDRFEEVLRRLNMSHEDALKIIDALMVRGDRYRETIILLNGRLPVVFQTRKVSDSDLLTETMESRRPQYYAGISAEHWRHYLAASIVRYGNRTFNDSSLDDYEARMAWVNALQEPVFNMLVVELQQFDEKIKALLKPSFLRHF